MGPAGSRLGLSPVDTWPSRASHTDTVLYVPLCRAILMDKWPRTRGPERPVSSRVPSDVGTDGPGAFQAAGGPGILAAPGEPDGGSAPVRTALPSARRSRRCCFGRGLCAPTKANGRALGPLAPPGPVAACVQPGSPCACPGQGRGPPLRAGAEGRTAGVDASAWRRPREGRLPPRQRCRGPPGQGPFL